MYWSHNDLPDEGADCAFEALLDMTPLFLVYYIFIGCKDRGVPVTLFCLLNAFTTGQVVVGVHPVPI